MFEYLADLVRLGRVFLRLSEPNHLDGRLTARFPQPYIDEIKLEHTQKRVEQGMNNLGWLTAAPHGRKGEQADQITNATLKSLDLLCNISGMHIHIQDVACELLRPARRWRNSRRNSSGGTKKGFC